MTDLERLLSHVTPDGDCWRWGVSGNNYGTLQFRGRSWVAHRVSWTLHVGEIPPGLWVLHHCDHKWCVNPKHLYLGTHADNTRDAVERHRMVSGDQHHFRTKPECIPRGERNHRALLTEQQVVDIRERAARGERYQALAREFGLHSRQITRIARGEGWTHVAGTVSENRPRPLSGRGEANPSARLTADAVLSLRALHAQGTTYNQLAVQFGISARHVGQIVMRTRWRHLDASREREG